MTQAINVLLGVMRRVAAILIAALVAIMLVIVAGQFVDRHFVDLPWDAPDQFARIAVIWLCFLGAALALSEGTTIRIDLFDHLLPAWALSARDFIFDLVLLSLLIVLTVKGWTVTQVGSMQVLLGTPFTADVSYAAIFVGSALAAFFVAVRLVRRLIEPKTRKDL